MACVVNVKLSDVLALLLVKIFDGGFNGLTILNLLPTGLFVLHISGTAQMHCY